jgi:hypothetical protein
MSRAKALAKLYDNQKADAANSYAALTYQAKAWRICALIGLADQQRGAKIAQWLLFKTVPWVDGEALEKFIEENQDSAAEAGRVAGVFTQ